MQKMNNSISGTVGATVTARTVIRVSFCSLFSSFFFTWHLPFLRNLYEKLRRSAHQETLSFNERLDTLLSNNENLCRKTRGIRSNLGFWWRDWIPLYFINRFTEIIFFYRDLSTIFKLRKDLLQKRRELARMEFRRRRSP